MEILYPAETKQTSGNKYLGTLPDPYKLQATAFIPLFSLSIFPIEQYNMCSSQNNWLYNASGPNFEPPLEELNVYVITVNLGYEIMLNEKYMMLIFHLGFIQIGLGRVGKRTYI